MQEAAAELASSNKTSQHVFWAAHFVFAIQLHKSQSFEKKYHLVSSMAQWPSSECFILGSKLEKSTFCWIGFCAHDYFKHLEAKWSQLPWLLPETLLTTYRLALQYKSGTLAQCTGLAFFCQTPVSLALSFHVIIGA